METNSKENPYQRIEELENRLAEAEQLIEAIKAGEVDAFAINQNDKAEVYTLQSGDYAYRVLIENISEGALNLTDEGLIVYTNNYFNKLLDLPYENVIGLPVFNFIHPDDHDQFNKLLRKAQEGQGKGEINLAVNDKIIPVYISLTSLEPNLPTIGMIITDQSERVHHEYLMEQKNTELENTKIFLETVLDSSIEMVSTLDRNLNYTSINKKVEEFLGVKRQDIIGKNILDLFPTLKGSPIENYYKKAMGGEIVHIEAIPSISTPNKFLEVFIMPFVVKNEEPGVLIISRDISEIKLATHNLKNVNKELENKNQELKQSNAELASFSYIASHDLQEPLRKIQTFSKRILEKDADNFSPVTLDYFDRMIKASSRMQNLIVALLDYSRTNTEELLFNLTDLNQLLDEVKSNMHEIIEENKVKIINENLPTLHVIPLQFTQLFSNLISNSIKYRKADIPPVINIKARIVPGSEATEDILPPDQKFWEISFSDNGIGFEQEHAVKIFELFQRLHGKTEYEGTGIGLAICKKIMQNHRGYIKANSAPGEGATFLIYMPVIN